MRAVPRAVTAGRFGPRRVQSRQRFGVSLRPLLKPSPIHGDLPSAVEPSRCLKQLHVRCSSSSVSKSEVSKFSGFSKTWWDPRENPLIGMNSVRVEYVIGQVKDGSAAARNPMNGPQDESDQPFHQPLSGLSALDVGCGGGLLSESLVRLGATVTAIDPSHQLVNQAKLHAQLDPKTRPINYRGGCTVEQLAEERVSPSSSGLLQEHHLYDIICLLEVLEHVADVDSILSSTQRLLKPETGRLFVSTLNRTVKSQLIAIVGAEYIMRYLPPGTHDWNQFRSPAEVEVFANRAGLEQVDVQGMVVTNPPFFGQWDWRLDPNDVDVNWIASYKTKPNVNK
jgi:2-polyprenyl-6-hydroxyphenyl methylase/3-demethylubiquinone-9 3-methyltransferase